MKVEYFKTNCHYMKVVNGEMSTLVCDLYENAYSIEFDKVNSLTYKDGKIISDIWFLCDKTEFEAKFFEIMNKLLSLENYTLY